jgi:hypothetical protein
MNCKKGNGKTAVAVYLKVSSVLAFFWKVEASIG